MTAKERVIAKVSVSRASTIRQAMEVITRAPKSGLSVPAGLVLVTDQERKLLGIATDGDIRRAIERGATLESPISAAMNSDPFLIRGLKPNAEILGEVLAKIKKEGWRRDKIRNIIVVDAKKRVVDIVSFFDLWRNSEIRLKHIGVVGLGYVGLTLALTLAERGFQMRGLDRDPAVRRKLKSGRPHFFEIGLAGLLGDHLGKNFEVVSRFDAAENCDMYIIAVGTPVSPQGQPQFGHLENASRTVGRVLKYGDAVILRSTIPVGTTREVVIPILEKASRLTAGRDFYVAFAPERTVEGKALDELRRLPQVIGGIDRVSSEVAAHVFNTITSYSIIVESLEEAEMVKLINNSYRDVTFAFANELALVCHRWGIDTARVIEAANRDYDRGRVPMPSPGVGGYCLKKDPFIFISSARRRGFMPLLSPRARALSAKMIDFMAAEIVRFLRRAEKPLKKSKICVVGLAFKGEPVTSDIRGSTSLDLIDTLRPRVGAVVGFDPAVDAEDARRNGVTYARDIRRALKGADAVVVMNKNPDFKALNMRKLLTFTRRPVMLFDAWGLYPAEEIAKVKNVEYFKL